MIQLKRFLRAGLAGECDRCGGDAQFSFPGVNIKQNDCLDFNDATAKEEGVDDVSSFEG